MLNVVVTYPAQGEQRETLINVLGKVARVIFISDLSPQDRSKELQLADVLISWRPERELQSEELKIITRARMMQLISAGADQIHPQRLPPALVVASNVGAYAEPMAEHVLAMILALEKNLLDRYTKLKAGTFDQRSMNGMLRGSTCAILGFGGIGKATARLLRCFDVKLLAINTTGKTNEQVEFIGTLSALEHVLRAADVVVITLPLNNSTTGLVGSRELGWMKDTAILVNVARGQIVDETALYQRLKAHPSFMAAIDAWWVEPSSHGEFKMNYPFLELPNVLGSPHNSGIVPGQLLKGFMLAAENVKRFLNNEPIRGVIEKSDYE